MTPALRHPMGMEPPTMSLSTVDFDYVRALVQKRSAIVLDSDKLYLAETRLHSLARKEGYASLDALVAVVRGERDDGLSRKVVEAMTTNETSFFRDLQPFEALRTTILPEIIRQRQTERSLKIWCAACATGQEPYSIAMLLREHFPFLLGWDIKILASDIATEVLDRARAGRFSQLEVNRGLPARLLVKYFTKQGNVWQIDEGIRRLVDFRPINLVGDWPALPDFDVVFLRNVLIYFDLPTKKQIFGRIKRLLKPGSALLLGGAETTLNIDDGYERVQLEKATYYRTANR